MAQRRGSSLDKPRGAGGPGAQVGCLGNPASVGRRAKEFPDLHAGAEDREHGLADAPWAGTRQERAPEQMDEERGRGMKHRSCWARGQLAPQYNYRHPGSQLPRFYYRLLPVE